MFKNAKPVFIKNQHKALNYQAGFKTVFTADENKSYKLVITGATLYEITLNGDFVGYGPARAPHGYIRYDEIELKVKAGENTLCVSVAGYNCPCFYSVEMNSFVQAEVFENGESIAYTGRDFKGISLTDLRIRQALRYSYQRTFMEDWCFDNAADLTNWKTVDFEGEPLMERVYEEELIPREWAMPKFNIDNSARKFRNGRFKYKDDYKSMDKRHFTDLANQGGFPLYAIAHNLIDAVAGIYFTDFKTDMTENRYEFYELDTNNTGFIKTKILAKEDSEIFVFGGERMAAYASSSGGTSAGIDMDLCGSNLSTIIRYELKKSDKPYDLQTFECYTVKYIGILVRKGEVEVQNVALREYSYPEYEATTFSCADKELECIFEAARNTYRQNTVDTFMDCPSRERAGWLCDSYFTGQSSLLFSGSGKAEQLYLKNFTMAKYFPELPLGMLPHNYPGEVKGFIPQWSMWYVLELKEYFDRYADDKEYYRTTVYDLLAWFKKYEIEGGLLGKTPGWGFIEWSLANEMIGDYDLSYPTNMLYSKVLSDIGEMYNDNALIEQSNMIKKYILDNAFDGVHFVDGAAYNESGKLENFGEMSEACQHYAMMFGIVDKNDERFEKFFDLVHNVYGFGRRAEGTLMPEVAFGSAFIGYVVRYEGLVGLREYDRLIKDVKELYGPMAKATGTLWETEVGASYNHGFASVAAVYIMKSLSGITKIDAASGKVYVGKTFLGTDFDINMQLEGGSIKASVNNGERTVVADGRFEVVFE